ncbi:MAG: FHA domain-containing serine/threonine-protein kinase [Planctomycetota bacterium]
MQAEVYVLSGRDAGKGLSATPGPPIFVGRAATNQMRIRDPQASRVHCRIDVKADGLVLFDNNSGNGTFVNGERVRNTRRLDDLDEIRIGATRLKVLIESEEEQHEREGRPSSHGPVQTIPTGPRDRGGARPAEAESGERPPKNKLREVLPGYRLEARLGGHSHAGVAVYRAVQLSLERRVALKVLLAKGDSSEQQVARFLREAKAIARLPHPNIVTIHDVIQRRTLNVLVMELLAGGSLADRLEDGLDADETLELGRAVSAALAYAHEHEVIHRAVKPSNVLYAPHVPTFKLGDFGFATPPEEQTGETSFLVGTPLEALGYLAPEQLKADTPADARTDVYGLGATLYACLRGAPPFQGESEAEVAAAILNDPAPPLGEDEAPPELTALIARCLEKDPEARFSDGVALHAALLDVVLP